MVATGRPCSQPGAASWLPHRAAGTAWAVAGPLTSGAAGPPACRSSGCRAVLIWACGWTTVLRPMTPSTAPASSAGTAGVLVLFRATRPDGSRAATSEVPKACATWPAVPDTGISSPSGIGGPDLQAGGGQPGPHRGDGGGRRPEGRVRTGRGSDSGGSRGDPGVETSVTNASRAAGSRGFSETSTDTGASGSVEPITCAPEGKRGAPTGQPDHRGGHVAGRPGRPGRRRSAEDADHHHGDRAQQRRASHRPRSHGVSLAYFRSGRSSAGPEAIGPPPEPSSSGSSGSAPHPLAASPGAGRRPPPRGPGRSARSSGPRRATSGRYCCGDPGPGVVVGIHVALAVADGRRRSGSGRPGGGSGTSPRGPSRTSALGPPERDGDPVRLRGAWPGGRRPGPG